MRLFSRLFDRFKKVDGVENVRVIDGHVFFMSNEDPQIDRPKALGAFVFAGFEKNRPSFFPAKIKPNRPFHHFRIDRFLEGKYQKDIPAVAIDEPFNPDFTDGTADPEVTADPDPIPEPVFYLPAKFPESYLVEGLASDLGGFLDFLKNSKCSKETMTCYSLDIRFLHQELEGNLNPEKIKNILHKISSNARRNRMLAALKTYGKYRLIFGDYRITMILSTSPDIRKVRQTPKPQKTLSKEMTELYLLQAENLCRAGDRTGVWMALCLYGFKPSEFPSLKLVETPGSRMNRLEISRPGGKIHTASIPAWLFRAIADLSPKERGGNRITIYKGLQKYGTYPRQLYNNAAADDMERDHACGRKAA
ncbi:MAG: hypothetical protein R2941_17435 [Desulfobacterales bacterium]